MKASIIIATHDRADSLARLLHSLAAQIVPGNHEILIADNGTAAPSPIPGDVPLAGHIHDPAPGKCRVQNRAIAKAQGEIIVFIDDDLVSAPTYLAAVERFFLEHPEFAAMKGKVLPAQDPLKVAGENWAYMDLPIVDHGEEVCEVRGVLGANMAFRAPVFSRLGRFDERLGPGACGHEEDTEMSLRIRAAGMRIGFCPGALVYHNVDPARADRARFIRIARERGRCQMIHGHHSRTEVLAAVAYSVVRLGIARALRASSERLAREDRRFATALGMLDGLRIRRAGGLASSS
ncbi:MAG TPA: glycosyltransferase [Candidatus Binataceae bacterium]|nr:glycosyltransferase [Candidatus Binataceae bacterium]